MTYFGFCVLLVLNFVLLPCKGDVIPPSSENITVLPGSTARLKWTFTGDVSRASQFWYFTRNGGSEEEIAIKFPNQPVIISNSSLVPGVAIENPLTLVLKNVDESFNGRYRLNVAAIGGGVTEVYLLVAAKPSVTINCSDHTTVNESNDVICVCKSQGGVPPANVTWYDKDDVQIGNTSYGENILTLTKVAKERSGRYTCKAQSFTLIDEKSFELIVHYKPINTTIKVPKEAYMGEKLEITCDSDGLPAPTFTITHNVTTRIVSNKTTYTKKIVQYSDAGIYTCIAKNSLGNDTDFGNLTIKEKRPSTKKPTTQSTKPATKKPTTKSTRSTTTERTTGGGGGGGGGGLSTGAIVGIIVGVLLLVVIVVIVVYFCNKSKEKDGRNRGNIDPIAGNHYELENEPSPGDNAYDTVGPVGESGSKKKAPERDTLPPVYAAVDKNNRQGNTLYASLDNDALKIKRESKKEPADRTPQTEYASIDFAKTTDVPKADLV